MRTRSGSDIESENEDGGSRRLTMAEIIAEAFSKKKRLNLTATNADFPAEKCPHQQVPTKPNKHTRLDDVRSKSHSSSCHGPSTVSPGLSPTSVGVDDEVKCAPKEITTLLNTVVKRGEKLRVNCSAREPQVHPVPMTQPQPEPSHHLL